MTTFLATPSEPSARSAREDFERRLDTTYTVDTLAELDELVRSLPEPIDLPTKSVAPLRRDPRRSGRDGGSAVCRNHPYRVRRS